MIQNPLATRRVKKTIFLVLIVLRFIFFIILLQFLTPNPIRPDLHIRRSPNP